MAGFTCNLVGNMHRVIEVHEIRNLRNALPSYGRACLHTLPHRSESFARQPFFGMTVDALLRCRHARISGALGTRMTVEAVDLKTVDMYPMVKRNRLTYPSTLAPRVGCSHPRHGKTRHRNC